MMGSLKQLVLKILSFSLLYGMHSQISQRAYF